MAEQDQVNSRDLNLLAVFTSFIAAYASLHKFFLPVALKLTPLNDTAYSEIQPTLILPLSLALLITRETPNRNSLSFLSGASILFAAYEVYLTTIGVHVGWLAFSRLLSSLPLATISIIFLSRRTFRANKNTAWIGAIAFALFAGGHEWRRTQVEVEPIAVVPTTAEPPRELPQHTNAECGAQALTTFGEAPATNHRLQIQACGLSPSLIKIQGSTLTIENKTDRPVNLHLIIGDGNKSKTGWNMLVRARETAKSRKIELADGAAGLLYSDSQPWVGIVGLLPNANQIRWAFSRKPIGIKRSP